MPLRPPWPLFISLALIFVAALPGRALARSDDASAGPSPTARQERAAENDDLVPVVLGTVGVIAVAGGFAAIGYLYRRQTGMAARYDDGFTPRDPRDRPTH